jgi:hypothetical protein
LLNMPELFEEVKEKITAEIFNVPILGQMAEILFDVLNADTKATLRQVLARMESVKLGNCCMELAQTGEEKGNFESRLAGALETIERYRKRNKSFGTVEEQRQYLRRFGGDTGRENPHSVGMI